MIPQPILSTLYDEKCLIGNVSNCRKLAGGSIHSVISLQTSSSTMVLKFCYGASGLSLMSEVSGLKSLRDTNFLVPEIFHYGESEGWYFLLMEYLPMQKLRQQDAQLFASRLSEMHSISASQFGYHEDNHIGSIRQINRNMDNWSDFFVKNRLAFQFELLGKSLPQSMVLTFEDELIEKVTQKLSEHHPEPSLLHGDLWYGNAARSGDEVVIFDPAVYYGDRETDLAMMKLFGGYDETLFELYEQMMPLPKDHEWRCVLYQLYHSLNHMNLFGDTYEAMTLNLIKLLNTN